MKAKHTFLTFIQSYGLVCIISALLSGCTTDNAKICPTTLDTPPNSNWEYTVVPEFRLKPGDDILTVLEATVESAVPSESKSIVNWLVDGSRTNTAEAVRWGRPLVENIRTLCETNGLVFMMLADAFLVFEEPVENREQVYFCSGSIWAEKEGYVRRPMKVKFLKWDENWVEATTAVSANGEFMGWASMEVKGPVAFHGGLRIEKKQDNWFGNNPISEIQVTVDGFPPYTLDCTGFGGAITVFNLHLAFIDGMWKKLDNATVEK